MFGLESLKKLLIEKWVGRLITIAVAGLGGVLVGLGVETAVVNSWTAATQDLLSALVPIIIAIILDQLQHKVALNAPPPK